MGRLAAKTCAVIESENQETNQRNKSMCLCKINNLSLKFKNQNKHYTIHTSCYSITDGEAESFDKNRRGEHYRFKESTRTGEIDYRKNRFQSSNHITDYRERKKLPGRLQEERWIGRNCLVVVDGGWIGRWRRSAGGSIVDPFLV